MAARGWEIGWNKQSRAGVIKYPWAGPIRDVLIKERSEARARAHGVEQEARAADLEKRKKIRESAIETVESEIKGVERARRNAVGLGSLVGQIIVSCVPLVERLKESMTTTAMDPKGAMSLLTRVGYITRQSNEATRLAIELERLRVGDPNEVLKDHEGLVGDVTPQEAAEQLADIGRSLERAKKRGMVVDLGDDEEIPQEVVDDGNDDEE